MFQHSDITATALNRGDVSDRLQELGFRVYLTSESVAYMVPPFTIIPPGSFLMGTRAKDRGIQNEFPQHEVHLPRYAIGIYLLTVAEYRYFLHGVTTASLPMQWDSQRDHLEHPVVGMTWEDAWKYTTWLSYCTGNLYHLPSEAQWEKAARGTDGRWWPWGNQWDARHANTYEGGRGHTTPIGSYPSGASPYGCLDMAGNVSEWSSSLFKRYPYDATDGREDRQATGMRVVRGGSFMFTAMVVRTATRIYPMDGIASSPEFEASMRASMMIGVRLATSA